MEPALKTYTEHDIVAFATGLEAEHAETFSCQCDPRVPAVTSEGLRFRLVRYSTSIEVRREPRCSCYVASLAAISPYRGGCDPQDDDRMPHPCPRSGLEAVFELEFEKTGTFIRMI